MKNLTTKLILALILAGSVLTSTFCFAHEPAGVDIHGFVSQGFIWSDEYNYLTNDSKDGSFQYNEVGINFGKDLTDQLRVGIQLFSRDLGDAANNKITIDWAYGDYRLKDWLGFRAGRIKLPIGFYNETRDVDLLRTSIVLPQSNYPDLLRDTIIAVNGASLYGNIDMVAAGSIDYQFIAGQADIDNESGFEKYFEAKFPILTLNDDPDAAISCVGSLRWNTPVEGLAIGISGMQSDVDYSVSLFGTNATLETVNTVIVYSAEYTWNDLVLSSEYLTYKIESNMGTGWSETTSEGYYFSAAYRFTDLFSIGAYYSIYHPNKDDRDGDTFAVKHDAWEKDLALTFRFDINEYIIFKLEGHLVDGTARVNATDNPVRTEDEFAYGVAKVTVSF